MATVTFTDRGAAGVALAPVLQAMKLRGPVTVLALPRGGVPVGYQIARALGVPLDVLVVRKIGFPGQPEFAIGAIATGNVVVREPGVESCLEPGESFDALVQSERRELERRERVYRAGEPPLQLTDGTTVLVDDGLATGCTMLAAVRAVRRAGARTIIVAAPVASREAFAILANEADAMAILEVPDVLRAIGESYVNFDQVGDEEVCELLAASRRCDKHLASRPSTQAPLETGR
jgi:putative phosphoribosyl transferase